MLSVVYAYAEFQNCGVVLQQVVVSELVVLLIFRRNYIALFKKKKSAIREKRAFFKME